MEEFSKKNIKEKSLVLINISPKPREEFFERNLSATKDSSQKWLKLEVLLGKTIVKHRK